MAEEKIQPKSKKKIIIISSVFVALIFVVVGLWYFMPDLENQKQAEDFYSEGISLLEEKKYSESVVEFKKAINADSKNLKSYLEVADIYIAKNNADEALAILDEAEKALGEDPEINHRRGDIYMNLKGDLGKALEYYSSSITDKVELTKLYIQNNELDKAKTILESVRESEPSFAEASLLLAYIDTKSFQVAYDRLDKDFTKFESENANLAADIDEYKKLLKVGIDKKDESTVSTLTSLGYILVEKEYFYLAIPVFQEVTTLLDEYSAGHLYLGYSYFKTGKLDEAEKQLKVALDRDSTLYEAHSFLGQLYSQKGEQNASLDEYDKAVKLEPKNEKLLYDYARVLEKFGIYTKAELIYKSLDEFKGDDWIDYRLALVDLYLNELKEFEKARAVLETLIDEWEGFGEASPILKAKIYDYYGWTYYNLSDTENAEKYFNLAYENDKFSPEVHFHLGKMLREGGGDMNQAKNYLERAIDLDFDGHISKEAQKEIDAI